MTPNPSFRDVEKLSAYLDGQLKPSEIARLESRFQSEPELASALKDLRQARGVLRQLPQRRAPRNFILTPKMVGLKPPMPRTYPVFRFATVLATLLLFFTFATNFMAPRMMQTAPVYPYGIGGRGGGAAEPELAMEAAPVEEALEEREVPAMTLEKEAADELAEPPAPAMEAPLAPEAPAPAEGEPTEQEMPAPAPTEGAVTADDSARVEPAPEQNGMEKAAPGETYAQDAPPDVVSQAQPAPPIGVTLQIALAAIAIISALVTFILRYITIRKWRAKAR
jgi:hypothetical protein